MGRKKTTDGGTICLATEGQTHSPFRPEAVWGSDCHTLWLCLLLF